MHKYLVILATAVLTGALLSGSANAQFFGGRPAYGGGHRGPTADQWAQRHNQMLCASDPGCNGQDGTPPKQGYRGQMQMRPQPYYRTPQGYSSYQWHENHWHHQQQNPGQALAGAVLQMFAATMQQQANRPVQDCLRQIPPAQNIYTGQWETPLGSVTADGLWWIENSNYPAPLYVYSYQTGCYDIMGD